MGFAGDESGQTAAEYLLLIGAAILFVLVTVAVLRVYVFAPTLSNASSLVDVFRNQSNLT